MPPGGSRDEAGFRARLATLAVVLTFATTDASGAEDAAPAPGIRRGMIHGAHVVIFSRDAEADRAFFRDVLHHPFVDAGHGWLIFALPPAELAVHPDEEGGRHALYLMCDDVRAFVAEMATAGIACSAVDEQRWGSVVQVSLPGGSTIGVYQPKHPSPRPAVAR